MGKGLGWGGAPFVPSEFGDGVKLGSSDNRTPPRPPPMSVLSSLTSFTVRTKVPLTDCGVVEQPRDCGGGGSPPGGW